MKYCSNCTHRISGDRCDRHLHISPVTGIKTGSTYDCNFERAFPPFFAVIFSACGHNARFYSTVILHSSEDLLVMFNNITLLATPSKTCEGCWFADFSEEDCYKRKPSCSKFARSDMEDIIWKQVKEAKK